MLAQYQFNIVFRLGKVNGKADALTRQSGDLLKEGGDECDPRSRPFQTILDPATFPHTLNNATIKYNPDIQTTLATDTLAIKIVKALVSGAKQLTGKHARSQISLGECTVDPRTGLLYVYGLLYVPDKKTLYQEIIHTHYDHPTAGHPGRAATYEFVIRNYWWPGMRKTIARYLTNCDTCAPCTL